MIKKAFFFPIVVLLFSALFVNNENLFAKSQEEVKAEDGSSFSIVVIPDTQNYIDYSHQKNEGFAVNGREIFLAQMKDIAQRAMGENGNLAFVISVGDIWQHQTIEIDPEHEKRGFSIDDDPRLNGLIEFTNKTKEIEIPTAIEGYKILDNAEIPFGVVPGNHDYDAAWFENPRHVHLGGLKNFLSAFSSEGIFFKDKDWYIDSFKGGTNSAQKFKAGGYVFLHISLEMQPGNEVLEWLQTVLDKNSGLPTIISTHDFLNPNGEREPALGMDLAQADPGNNNSAEQLWEKIIFRNDQIFMILSGHHLGQATRIDLNSKGNQVYQIMANYQARGQIGIDAGQNIQKSGVPVGLGDGWYRILEFQMGTPLPEIRISTYSSHYKMFSHEMPLYAEMYKEQEQPNLSDSEFFALDNFNIILTDFQVRFGDLKNK